MKIAVLSRNSKLYSTARLVEEAQNAGHEARVIDTLKCYMDITWQNLRSGIAVKSSNNRMR